MTRVLPDDVVQAYKATGMIPIRLAWFTKDERGGCAIDCLARHRGMDTDVLRKELQGRYEEGFIYAWDSDDPRNTALIDKVKAEQDQNLKQGFCDGLLCRSAVEKTFSSSLFPVPDESQSS